VKGYEIEDEQHKFDAKKKEGTNEKVRGKW